MVNSMCGKCAKYILFAFNFIFWLSGGALLGVGIWMFQDKTIVGHLEALTLQPGEIDLQIATYVLIGTGGFIFLIGFFGCCGAVQESRCLLWIYALFMVVVIGAEAGAAVIVFLFKNKVQIFFKDSLKNELKDNYKPNSTLGMAWDMVHTQFKCCGAVGPFEWRETEWFRSEEAQTNGTQTLYAPWSCCKSSALVEGMGDMCQEEARGTSEPSQYIYVDGCYDKVMGWVKLNSNILIGVGAGIAALQILGLVFSCFLIYEIKQEKSVGVIA